jgi:hypothetical protein
MVQFSGTNKLDETPPDDFASRSKGQTGMHFRSFHLRRRTCPIPMMGYKNREIVGRIIDALDRLAPSDPAASHGPGPGNNNQNCNCELPGGTGTMFNLGARDTFR